MAALTIITCQAVERGLRCNAKPPAGSKWCSRHEELQAKSLKTYKRFSFELEGYQECHATVPLISACNSQETLREWATCLRKKWVFTKRTADARIKHHTLFYAGGDSSHQAFIDNLTTQRIVLEEKLYRIDERAYELLKENEKLSWLDSQTLVDPICDQSQSFSTPLIPSESTLSTISTAMTGLSVSDDAEEEEIFSDTESRSGSSDSCTSTCCQIPTPAPVTHKSRVLGYFEYPNAFACDMDRSLAEVYIACILRYAISRVPSLLVRCRSVDCPSVLCFLQGDVLQEEEYGRLWMALKYSNAHPEGKLSVAIIRNAIYDAENSEDTREGTCLELLGGQVWKEARHGNLKRRGWDHFYRFTSCSGCALSITSSFECWAANRSLARPGGRYSTWSDESESLAEQQLRACGVIICGKYFKGRRGAMEHVKPKKKGMRSVWIERDSRNWCFVRMQNGRNLKALNTLAGPSYDVLAWPDNGVSNIVQSCIAWITRLRSGYNANDRRSARWTTESSFHFSDTTHKCLLSTSPETCFRQGQPFSDPTQDVLIIDASAEQSFDKFLAGVASYFMSGPDAHGERASPSVLEEQAPLLDRALYLGRSMFREAL